MKFSKAEREDMIKALGDQVILRRAGGPSQVIHGIFSNEAIEQFSAIVNQPVLQIAENCIDISVGDVVEINRTVYSIREQFEDGDGFVTLTLRLE